MTHSVSTSKNQRVERIFSSPIALAFVRTATARGITAAEARQRYLEYLRKPQRRETVRAT